MTKKLFYILIACLVVIFTTIGIAHKVNSKQNSKPKQTIYTPKDIYYIYKDSITTESGVVITDFKNAFIELQTACDLH